MQVPQAIRAFDLAPCSELRFDLRYQPPKQQSNLQQQQQQPLQNLLQSITVRLEPRDNAPISADWFGFPTNTNTGSAGDCLTFRIGCTREPSTTALFTASGCVVTVEGPAAVVQKCMPLSFFELDLSLRPKAAAAGAAAAATTSSSSDLHAWPLWRRQALRLHEYLHEQRLAAYRRGPDIDERIGPRVLVCGSRSSTGRTTLCRTLLNLAARDGFHPLFVAADASGTSLIGQPGCFAACFADHGFDPTEGGAHYPVVQVALPLEDCERSKLAEPWRFSISALMEHADMRTFRVASCASGGLVVDTDAVDEFASEDDIERLVAVIDECAIDFVIVVGSEHLRNTLRCRLVRGDAHSNNSKQTGNSSNNNPFANVFGGSGGVGFGSADDAASVSAKREELGKNVFVAGASDAVQVQQPGASAIITIVNFPVIDGAEDSGTARTGAAGVLMQNLAKNTGAALSASCAAVQARWHRYFFGTTTSPLSAWRHTVPLSESKWCVLRSVSSGYGGLLPLQGAGEEQKSVFRAVAHPVSDVAARFISRAKAVAASAGASGSTTAPLLIAALVRCADVSSATCSSDIIGFVAVMGVVTTAAVSSAEKDSAATSTTVATATAVEILAPSPALPHLSSCVFALMHSACQP